jgi:hypothetical protein
VRRTTLASSVRWEEALPVLKEARRLAEKEGAAVGGFVRVPPDEDLSGDSLTPVITLSTEGGEPRLATPFNIAGLFRSRLFREGFEVWPDDVTVTSTDGKHFVVSVILPSDRWEEAATSCSNAVHVRGPPTCSWQTTPTWLLPITIGASSVAPIPFGTR